MASKRVQVVGGRKPAKKVVRRKKEVSPDEPRKTRKRKGEELPEDSGLAQSKYMTAALEVSAKNLEAQKNAKPFTELDMMKGDLKSHRESRTKLQKEISQNQTLIHSYNRIISDLEAEIEALEKKGKK